MSPEPMTIKEFSDKYDSGGGFGCTCHDCGWNKAGNRVIYKSEVENAVGENNYEEVAADFRRLNADLSKQTAAGYFDTEVAYEVAIRLDPRYAAFRKKFDKIDVEDTYTLDEVNLAGGIKVFKAEIAGLDPDLQIFISGRMTDDVFVLMKAGTEQVFWATYDANHDHVIDSSEVQVVSGTWDRFLADLKELKEGNENSAVAVLESLRGVPPDRTLSEIRSLFPEYTDRYNLKQFPFMGGDIFPNVREGLKLIKKFTGRDVEAVSRGAVPLPAWALAVSPEEQLYTDLAAHLSTRPAGYKMDVNELANFISRNRSNEPRATIAALAKGLGEDSRRYLGVQYTMNISRNFDMVDSSYTDGYKTVQVSARNKGLIKALKGMRFQYIKGESYYQFYMPIARVEYGSLACDAGAAGSVVTCMPMGFEMEFPEYEVIEDIYAEPQGAIRFENMIVRNRFDRSLLEGVLSRFGAFTVKAVKRIMSFDSRALHGFLTPVVDYSLELMINNGLKMSAVRKENFYSDTYTWHPPKPKPTTPGPNPTTPWPPDDPDDPGPGDEDTP